MKIFLSLFSFLPFFIPLDFYPPIFSLHPTNLESIFFFFLVFVLGGGRSYLLVDTFLYGKIIRGKILILAYSFALSPKFQCLKKSKMA